MEDPPYPENTVEGSAAVVALRFTAEWSIVTPTNIGPLETCATPPPSPSAPSSAADGTKHPTLTVDTTTGIQRRIPPRRTVGNIVHSGITPQCPGRRGGGSPILLGFGRLWAGDTRRGRAMTATTTRGTRFVLRMRRRGRRRDLLWTRMKTFGRALGTDGGGDHDMPRRARLRAIGLAIPPRPRRRNGRREGAGRKRRGLRPGVDHP